MFTFEIGGIPIAVTNADEIQALEVFDSEAFKRDLMAMTSEGTPLWDGKAPLAIRSAFRHEVSFFDALGPDLDDLTDEAEDDSVFVTFLVPIDHEETSAASQGLQS
jgi:hypothetical protein